MQHFFNILIGSTLLLFLSPVMVIIAIMLKLSSKEPIIYWSTRVSKNRTFKMPKFRSMIINTPIESTEKLQNAKIYLTSIGKFLRPYGLDELPQIFSIIKGDMNFIGPRPHMPSETKLKNLREKNGINEILPGITGWAQVNGRDNLSVNEKVQFDLEYLENQSFYLDLKIIFLTIFKIIKKEGVKH